jgi:hypothetical protein
VRFRRSLGKDPNMPSNMPLESFDAGAARSFRWGVVALAGQVLSAFCNTGPPRP